MKQKRNYKLLPRSLRLGVDLKPSLLSPCQRPRARCQRVPEQLAASGASRHHIEHHHPGKL